MFHCALDLEVTANASVYYCKMILLLQWENICAKIIYLHMNFKKCTSTRGWVFGNDEGEKKKQW